MERSDLNRAFAGVAVTLGGIAVAVLISQLAPVAIEGAAAGVAGIQDFLALAVSHAQAIAQAAAQAAARAVTRALRIRLIPIFPVFQALWPDIYRLDATYIAAFPHRQLLTYNPAVATTNRAWVQTNFGLSTAPLGQSLDEYPFASTNEGGPFGPAVGAYVRAWENWSQGGTLAAFYRVVLRRITGSPFIVLPIP
jgi:hypothetical protein